MKAFLTILAAAVVMPLAAQENKAASDTIVVTSPNSVVVTKGKDGAIGVSVQGKDGNSRYRLKYNTKVEEKDTADWNLDLPFLGKRKGEWHDMSTTGLYAGAAICNGEPAGSGLHYGVDFGVTHLIGTKYNFGGSGLGFSTGLGFGLKYLMSDKSELRFNRVNGALTFEPLPEGATDGELSVVHWNLTMPLQLTQRIDKEFVISAGIQLCYNFYTSAENQYKLNGVEYTETVKHLKQRPFSFEYSGVIGWKNISLYCRYNPQGMFRNGFGPQFSTFSVGFSFFNF